MKLPVKNLIYANDFIIARKTVEEAGFTIISIYKGGIEIAETLNRAQWQSLNAELKKHNHGLCFDRLSRITEKIKIIISENLFSEEEVMKNYLREKICEADISVSYEYLSSIFSKTESIPLQKYIIMKKAEMAEILIMEGQYSLTEISLGLGYTRLYVMKQQYLNVKGKTLDDFISELKPA